MKDDPSLLVPDTVRFLPIASSSSGSRRPISAAEAADTDCTVHTVTADAAAVLTAHHTAKGEAVAAAAED